MKRKIAYLLLKLAKCICPKDEFSLADVYMPKTLGIGYHITKADVRKFRKEHPEYTSHRKGLEALIEETKMVILGNLVAGLREKDIVIYKVNKTLWTANVTGKLNVYVLANMRNNGLKEDK